MPRKAVKKKGEKHPNFSPFSMILQLLFSVVVEYIILSTFRPTAGELCTLDLRRGGGGGGQCKT